MNDGGRPEARRDYARTHPVRIAILALAANEKSLNPEDLRRAILTLANQGKSSTDPEDLRRELPKRPTIDLIDYHLLVLRQVGLLPRH